MAWKTLKYKLTGDAPLIMHNGQMSDPMNKWAKLIKMISSKRIKTDADLEEMARLEFFGSLYLDEEGPIIPIHVVEGLVIAASKKSKEGPAAKAGCFCPENSRLEYEGPRTAKELWADEQYHLSAGVKLNGKTRVQRMRPIFNKWSTIITLNIEDTLVNPSRVDEWLNVAGTQCGLGDWKPQHGRFTAQRLNGK